VSTIGFTDNYPHEGAYLVYINGIEVPVEAVSINSNVGGVPPTATLQLAPDPILARLGAEDRVEVQVFYLDDIFPQIDQKKEPDFRLLYEGEITGWSYVNTARGRSLSFRCRNFLKILEDLKPSYITGFASVAQSTTDAPQGDEVAFLANPLLFPWSRFFYGLDQTQEKLIRRPYDLIMNAIDSVSTGTAQEKYASSVAVNFFARYMARTMFRNRFVPSPVIETDVLSESVTDSTGVFPILRAVQSQKVVETMVRGAASNGQDASIWGTIQQLFLRLYYETATIMAAPIAQVNRVPNSTANGTIIGPPKFKGTQPDSPAEAQKPNCLVNYVTKPQWLFGVIPSCNVVFPSMIDELRMDEDYEDQPTRLYINDLWYIETTTGNDPMGAATAALRSGYPEQVEREMNKRFGDGSTTTNPTVSGRNFLIWPEEFFKGPKPANVRLPEWFTMLAETAQSSTDVSERQAQLALQELKDTEAQGNDVATVIASLVKRGMVPESVGQTASTTQAVLQVKQILELQAGGKTAFVRALRRSYARYEYYRQRSQFRSGSVSMTFNPYIIAGYPGVFFDEAGSGQHIVGYVVAVSTELSDEGWSTTVTLAHVQPLDEFIQEVYDARVGNTAFGVQEIDAAPANPIGVIRDTLQTLEGAEAYFGALLHQNTTYAGIKSAAFDLNAAIELVLPSGMSYPYLHDLTSDDETKQRVQALLEEADEEQAWIDKEMVEYQALLEKYENLDPITLLNKVNLKRGALQEDSDKRRAEALSLTPKEKFDSPLLQSYIAFRPSTRFAAMFENHTNAMRFVSRPVCTLEEYISFRGRRGLRVGGVQRTDPVQGKGGRFYEQILDLQSGPNPAPTFDQNNNLVHPRIAQLADTRSDWTRRLKIYRQRILFKKMGWRPNEE